MISPSHVLYVSNIPSNKPPTKVPVRNCNARRVSYANYRANGTKPYRVVLRVVLVMIHLRQPRDLSERIGELVEELVAVNQDFHTFVV